MPDKKRPKYLTISDKESKKRSNSSDKEDDKLCVISEVTECKHNDLSPSMDDRQSSTQQPDPHLTIPIFVLHPSATYYLPMNIDASLVSRTLKKNTNYTSTPEHVQCHPVSIPVNFSPLATLTDSSELDIQNINIVGNRLQTSVRPN